MPQQPEPLTKTIRGGLAAVVGQKWGLMHDLSRAKTDFPNFPQYYSACSPLRLSHIVGEGAVRTQ